MDKKIHKYYLAYCFKVNDYKSGFGNIIISNSNKLSINSIEDIEEVVKESGKKKDNVELKDVVIMDFRELGSEDSNE